MHGNVPSRKKDHYPVLPPLREYLLKHDRERSLPISYDDLLRYQESFPLLDRKGNDTLWLTLMYSQYEMNELNRSLCEIYSLLKADGDHLMTDHLSVARIDFCTFGNSKPFRIRIINRLNDNYDHFYVKRADASRIYGLELEHLLSPNKIFYLVDGPTLIEEHIIGVPGDEFMRDYLDTPEFNQIRIAKEFVKFNERCFVRLLGDMRAYNYVFEISPDIEGQQYRMRAIDFDQQSYEGRMNFYLPQYFKENNPIIFLGIKHMSPETVWQYQLEERSMTAARIRAAGRQPWELLEIMKRDRISKPRKVEQLRTELASHHGEKVFLKCRSMGEIVSLHIRLLLRKAFKQSMSPRKPRGMAVGDQLPHL